MDKQRAFKKKLKVEGIPQVRLADTQSSHTQRGGGLGSRPTKMYGERLGDGVEYHLMKPTPRR